MRYDHDVLMSGAAISVHADVGDHTTLEVRIPEGVHSEETGVLVRCERTEVARSMVLAHILQSEREDGVDKMAYFQFNGSIR